MEDLNNSWMAKIKSDYERIKIHSPEIVPIKPIAQSLAEANYASEFYERLKGYIIKFEESLSDDEDVAIRLVSFGESIVIQVDNLGYHNPSLISFTGTTKNGDRVELIQHVSQISFLLMAVKLPQPIPERERIGYKLRHETVEE